MYFIDEKIGVEGENIVFLIYIICRAIRVVRGFVVELCYECLGSSRVGFV